MTVPLPSNPASISAPQARVFCGDDFLGISLDTFFLKKTRNEVKLCGESPTAAWLQPASNLSITGDGAMRGWGFNSPGRGWRVEMGGWLRWSFLIFLFENFNGPKKGTDFLQIVLGLFPNERSSLKVSFPIIQRFPNMFHRCGKTCLATKELFSCMMWTVFPHQGNRHW